MEKSKDNDYNIEDSYSFDSKKSLNKKNNYLSKIRSDKFLNTNTTTLMKTLGTSNDLTKFESSKMVKVRKKLSSDFSEQNLKFNSHALNKNSFTDNVENLKENKKMNRIKNESVDAFLFTKKRLNHKHENIVEPNHHDKINVDRNDNQKFNYSKNNELELKYSNFTSEEVICNKLQQAYKEEYSFHKNILILESIIGLILIIKVILFYVLNEIYIGEYDEIYDFNQLDKSVELHIMESKKDKSTVSIIKFVCLFLSIIDSFLYLILTYLVEKEDLYKYWAIDIKSFIKKILNIIYYTFILAIHIPPHVNYSYAWHYNGYVNILNLNAIVLAISFLSLPFILKTVANLSRWNSINARYISHNEYSRNDFIFFLKCEFKHRPMFICLFIFILFTIIITFTLRIFESGTVRIEDSVLIRNRLEYFWNSMHFIIFTVTSVGYGDIVPKSISGKIIAAICCILGNAVIGLFIASVAVISEFNINEKKAYEILNALKQDENLKRKAGEVILNMLIFRKLIRIRDRNKNESFNLSPQKFSATLMKKIIKEKSNINVLDTFKIKKNIQDKESMNDELYKSNFLKKTFNDYSKIMNHSKILFNFFTVVNHIKKSTLHFKNENNISKLTAFVLEDNLKLIENSMEIFLENLKIQVTSLESAVDITKESHYDINVCHERMKNINFMTNRIYRYMIKLNNKDLKS